MLQKEAKPAGPAFFPGSRKGGFLIRSTLFNLTLLLFAATLASPFPAGAAPVTIAAVGDVMMGSDFPTPKLPPRGGRELLSAAAPLFKKADIAMANLEGPLLSGGTPAKEPLPGRRYLFRTPPYYAANLKRAGISMVSLANNHANDFGRDGLSSTKEALALAGVLFSGKEGEVAEFSVRGLTVGVVAFSYGAPPRSVLFPARAMQEISRLSERYDVLVLSVHAGAEGRQALHVAPGMEEFLGEERGDLVAFARGAVDCGADLVVGHGPHVPRALELYRGRLIAYSLGNFATFGGMSVEAESGFAPLLTVRLDEDGSFMEGEIASFMQRPYARPLPDPKRRAFRLMRRLSAQDFPDSPLRFEKGGRITADERR